jgi:hypothetical protein
MIQVLSNSYQRALGAMFRIRGLAKNVLIFVYPVASKRLYTTWFCPPLRILCFGELGDVIFNEVLTGGRFVELPETRLVIEVDPDYPYLKIVREIRDTGTDVWISRHISDERGLTQNIGGARADDPFGRLLFGLIRDAIEDLSKVKNMIIGEGPQEAQKELSKLPAWRRGQIICSASFVLDVVPAVPYQIPPAALKLSRTLLQLDNEETQKELLAAAIAGVPWNIEAACFRCSNGGSWRQILKPSSNLPALIQWRFDRPENHIPLCNLCENTLDLKNINLAVALGYCYWGYRFEAFSKWLSGVKNDQLPAECWNLDDFPLWPREYGGDTWAKGSGAVQHCFPHSGRVVRAPHHVDRLRRIMLEGQFRPGRMQRGQLYNLLQRSQ